MPCVVLPRALHLIQGILRVVKNTKKYLSHFCSRCDVKHHQKRRIKIWIMFFSYAMMMMPQVNCFPCFFFFRSPSKKHLCLTHKLVEKKRQKKVDKINKTSWKSQILISMLHLRRYIAQNESLIRVMHHLIRWLQKGTSRLIWHAADDKILNSNEGNLFSFCWYEI